VTLTLGIVEEKNSFGKTMNSRIESGEKLKREEKNSKKKEKGTSLEAIKEEKMTLTEINEVVKRYLLRGWRKAEGAFTLGFVSPCGEHFNCYDIETGKLYSYNSFSALEICQRASDVKKGEK
jgi:hypothetical protein